MRLKRSISGKILKLLDLFPVVVLVGARQTGKTTLVRNLRPDWRYLDLEAAGDYQLVENDPGLFLRQNAEAVIFDEAQLLPSLFSELRHAIDQDRDTKGRYLITGSSSPTLLRSISESLAGRAATVQMGTLKASERYGLPLSPLYSLLEEKEIEQHRFKELKPSLSDQQVLHHWFGGGYPEPALSEDELFQNLWLENYLDRYVGRDLSKLFPGLNHVRYRRFISLLANLTCKTVNQSDLARALEVSAPTVKDYVDIAAGSFLWRSLTSFERNVTKAVAKMPKGHMRDSGLIHALLKLGTLEQLQAHPIMGYSFEAFVVEELIKGLEASNMTNWSVHHYRTRAKTEIDLIIDTPRGPIPVEVKYSSTLQRKWLAPIREFMKSQSCPVGLFINNSETVELLDEGSKEQGIGKLYQIPARCL